MLKIPTLENGYSRENPSPKYRELLDFYLQLHENGDPRMGHTSEQTFEGRSLFKQIGNIGALTQLHNAKTLLDYGAGKGALYQQKNLPHPSGRIYRDINEFWNVDSITCYDPAFPEFSKLPINEKFDGVISVDVMEHCPKEDLPWILDEIFSFAEKFVFANVNGRKADRLLPNGENAHCTIEPLDWWAEVFENARSRYPQVKYYIIYSSAEIGSDGQYVDYAFDN